MPVGFPWTQQAITRTSPSLALLEWERDLMHGLGGAKENFYAAFQSAALAHCDLLALDFPGTGPADFDPTKCADVSTLADLAHLVWNKLLRWRGIPCRSQYGRGGRFATHPPVWCCRRSRTDQY